MFYPIICNNKHINAVYKIIPTKELLEFSGVDKISLPYR